MSEEYELNADGTADTWNFPSLADAGQPGLVMRVTLSTSATTGSISKGGIILPVPCVKITDRTETRRVQADGSIDLPSYAKAVEDINGNIWPLAQLNLGSWQAATVSKCVLEPATDNSKEKAIYLKLHTKRGGHCLCFELVANHYYSGV